MTVEQYITEVLAGRIVIEPPIPRVITDLEIPDEDKMEPVGNLRCLARHIDRWVCTRTKGHSGEHIGHTSDHAVVAKWE